MGIEIEGLCIGGELDGMFIDAPRDGFVIDRKWKAMRVEPIGNGEPKNVVCQQYNYRFVQLFGPFVKLYKVQGLFVESRICIGDINVEDKITEAIVNRTPGKFSFKQPKGGKYGN